MEGQDLGPEEFLGIKDATDLVGGAEDVAVAHGSSPSGTAADGRSPGHNGSYEGKALGMGEQGEREREKGRSRIEWFSGNL